MEKPKAKPRPRKFEIKEIISKGLKSTSALEFKDLFLRPFAKALEGEITSDYILNYFFNMLTRDIFWARVEEEVKLPGEYYIQGSRLIGGAGPRELKLGEVLTVRTDETQDYVDIERVVDKQSHVFRLTKAEYKWLQEKIRRMT